MNDEPTIDEVILREQLETLVYCINLQPRLFRWHDGVIQWAPTSRTEDDIPRQWHDLMSSRPGEYVTKSGKILTDADIRALADEAEQGYDVEHLKSERSRRDLAQQHRGEVVEGSGRPALSDVPRPDLALAAKYQEPMADGEPHPLRDVPPEIIATARNAMWSARDMLADEDSVEPVADMIVLRLHEAGFIRDSNELTVREVFETLFDRAVESLQQRWDKRGKA